MHQTAANGNRLYGFFTLLPEVDDGGQMMHNRSRKTQANEVQNLEKKRRMRPSVTLSADTLQAIDRMAAKEQRSKAAMIAVLVQEAIAARLASLFKMEEV